MADDEAAPPVGIEFLAQPRLGQWRAARDRVGQAFEDRGLLVGREERQDSLAGRAQVEVAPVAQGFPQVADGVARFDGIDGGELATDRVVQREHHSLADRGRRTLQDGPAHPPHVQVLRDQQADPREIRPDPEAAGFIRQ